MRVKDPSSSWGIPEKGKRNKRARKPPDEDSSDDIAGLTCQHVGRAVDVNQVKRSLAQNVWSICSDCLKERRASDGEPVMPTDVWLCLKCGHQGCSPNSEGQHSMKHFQTAHMDPHCIVISLSTWIVWCYECDAELSTHCNKKALAQMVDFLQKHASRTATGSSSKVIRLCEGNNDSSEVLNGKNPMNNTSVPVKGIHNLGNTCFFNAVMQNLGQTHILNELMHEMKEKGTKLKICLAVDSHPDPLVVNLSSPGPLTSAMFLFLHSMKDSEKGPLSPKVLFSQLCQKAPRFKVFQQQDSQELLHYLLDAVRIEETKRIQAGILKAFNNPTTKTADEETKRKVKAYGREGVKMNLIDRIFVGELTNTIMCEECENISTVKEPFIDLSLPIIEERVSKPVPQGRTAKCKTSQEADLAPYNCSAATTMTNQQAKLYRKQFLTRDKNLLNQERRLARKSSGDEGGSLLIMQQKNEMPEGENGLFSFPPEDLNNAFDAAANGSPSEGSERGAGSHCESSVDADSEASECETLPKQSIVERDGSTSGGPTIQKSPVSENEQPISDKPNDCCDNESLTNAISRLIISSTENDGTEPTPGDETWCLTNNSMFSVATPILSQNPQTAFQTLSHGYITSSKECSVQSCLYQFTSMELLMGNNKLLCESCTDRKQNYQRNANSSANEKKVGTLYTNARKQMLISAVPTILILHLKRFHQAGLSLRKVNRHVDFPLILDLAPFCSASCKNVSEGERVLYSLYGIVEHSGSMRGGHYAAYVKIRMPAKRLLEHMAGNKNVQDEPSEWRSRLETAQRSKVRSGIQKKSAGLKDTAGTSPGQWVYISDTHVQTVPESRVLNSQAYLLFYERLL